MVLVVILSTAVIAGGRLLKKSTLENSIACSDLAVTLMQNYYT
jgi:hypothetical protein